MVYQEHKIKTLSPAVSAFQFQTSSSSSPSNERKKSLVCATTPSTLSSTSDDYFGQPKSHYPTSSPSTPAINQLNEGMEETLDQNSYIYRNKVYKLDEETKQNLLKMGMLPLESEWTFWYDKFVPNLPATEYEANLKVISTVNTVQKFWSIYNNIDGPLKLGFRSNYHFMKKGIKPIWEDPHNEYGGSYNFKVNKKHTTLTWRDIMVLLIGEQVEDWIKNKVYGVSVSCRQHVDNYQIWTAHSNSNISDTVVKSTLTELLYPADIQSFYFKMHKSHADFKPTTPTTPTTYMSLKSTEMKRKITEESIERVLQDIEKLKLRVQ